MCYRIVLLVLCIFVGPTYLWAEFNNTFPRTRFFRDLYPQDSVSQGGRQLQWYEDRGGALSLKEGKAYDMEMPRAGLALHYADGYLWRDFLLSKSDQLFALDAYLSAYGFEASVFTIRDLKSNKGYSGSLELDYRFSYTWNIEQSFNTFSYTLYDFSDSAKVLGTPQQGFGKTPPKFDSEQHELAVSSYWLNEVVQKEGANFYVGADMWYGLDDSAFRSQAVAGAFGNRSGLHLAPNASRIQASVVFQAHYHTNKDSLTGSNFYFDASWDFQEVDIPVIATLGGEYFLPWGDDQFPDALLFFLRVGLVF